MSNRPWSPQDSEYLRANHGVLPKVALVKHLGRTPAAIDLQAIRLGIRSKYKMASTWTPEHDDLMRLNYRAIGCEKMALKLGRSRSAVSQRAAKLGLTKEGRLGRKPPRGVDEICNRCSYLVPCPSPATAKEARRRLKYYLDNWGRLTA